MCCPQVGASRLFQAFPQSIQTAWGARFSLGLHTDLCFSPVPHGIIFMSRTDLCFSPVPHGIIFMSRTDLCSSPIPHGIIFMSRTDLCSSPIPHGIIFMSRTDLCYSPIPHGIIFMSVFFTHSTYNYTHVQYNQEVIFGSPTVYLVFYPCLLQLILLCFSRRST